MTNKDLDFQKLLEAKQKEKERLLKERDAKRNSTENSTPTPSTPKKKAAPAAKPAASVVKEETKSVEPTERRKTFDVAEEHDLYYHLRNDFKFSVGLPKPISYLVDEIINENKFEEEGPTSIKDLIVELVLERYRNKFGEQAFERMTKKLNKKFK